MSTNSAIPNGVELDSFTTGVATGGVTIGSTTFTSVPLSKFDILNSLLSYNITRLESIEPKLKLKLNSPSIFQIVSIANVS